MLNHFFSKNRDINQLLFKAQLTGISHCKQA